MTKNHSTVDRTPFVLSLWPDGAPGSEAWQQHEQEDPAFPPFGIRIVRNITQPTLVAYLPDPAIATGAAVIIAPGGGFHFLAIDHEGHEVARWLNERGIAAFILKYRVIPTPDDAAEFANALQTRFGGDRSIMRDLTQQIIPLALARPDFVAPIYGALWDEIQVPANAPPLFIALTSDDSLALGNCLTLYSAWQKAGYPAELHIYAEGGHGFGMRVQGLPVDQWIERFYEWLKTVIP